MTVNRFDTYRVSEKVTKLDTGFLKVPVFATRTGVFNYQKSDGTVLRELRHPDEVFKADSLNTLSGVPLTNRHPTELVNPKNVRQYMVGTVGEIVERQDEFVKTSVTIMDEKTIAEVELSGLREVSCGYKCDVDLEPGVYEGQHYDAVQRNIKYNHLAIVDRGRAGRSVRLHMDAQDAELVEDGKGRSHCDTKTQGGRKMLVKIDGVEFEADNSLASAVTQALTKRDSALAEVKAELATAKADSEKKFDGLQAKFDQLAEDNKKLKLDAESVDVTKLVKARVSLVSAATPHLDKDTVTKLDDMGDRDVKIAVIKSKVEKFDAEGKSDDYVNARFDAIIEAAPKTDAKQSGSKLDSALATVDSHRKDNSEKTADEIRADAMQEHANAWQQPLTHSARAANGGK